LDDCQDWGLIGGEQSGGYTILEIVRKLTSDDIQDRPFHDGVVRIVWALGATDEFVQHTKRRPMGVVFYGEAPIMDLDFLILGDDGAGIYNFTQNNFALPAQKTIYKTIGIDLSSFIEDVHIIGIKYIIDEDTIANVHHFVLSGQYPDGSGEHVWQWAPGIAHLILPDNVGFRVGPGGYISLELQTHYDNPELRADLVDSSGLSIYYTSTLRLHDAGVMILGDPTIAEKTKIAAGIGFQEFEYTCLSECTMAFPYEINVFSSFLHMHANGAQMWTTHFRDDQLLRVANRVDFFDEAFQQQTRVDYVIQQGDRLNTHCVYRRNPGADVPFSYGSEAEMCMDFVGYWPKIADNAICGKSWVQPQVYCMGDHYNNTWILDPPFVPPHIVFGSDQEVDHVCPVNTYIQSWMAPTAMTAGGSTGAVDTAGGSTGAVDTSAGMMTSAEAHSTVDNVEETEDSAFTLAFVIISLLVFLF